MLLDLDGRLICRMDDLPGVNADEQHVDKAADGVQSSNRAFPNRGTTSLKHSRGGIRTCNTVLKPRRAVADTQMMNPSMWKLGSKPVAMTMPRTTGTKARYVPIDSRVPRTTKLSTAVNRGVVAPMA